VAQLVGEGCGHPRRVEAGGTRCQPGARGDSYIHRQFAVGSRPRGSPDGGVNQHHSRLGAGIQRTYRPRRPHDGLPDSARKRRPQAGPVTPKAEDWEPLNLEFYKALLEEYDGLVRDAHPTPGRELANRRGINYSTLRSYLKRGREYLDKEGN
jgi:hypothetical protein